MGSTKIPIPQPNNPDNLLDQFGNFVEIVKILRENCPWDKKQTHETIAQLLIEEAYETTNSIYENDDDEFSKELGDLLLHIVMHAVMAEERNAFKMIDVIKKISHKMIFRHPHVFGDEVVNDEEQVLKNWETLKKQERKDKSQSMLDGVPESIPGLLRAERIQHKVSRVGFDWDDKKDVWDKVHEEIDELRHELQNQNKEKAREELGDFIFAIVNAARHEEIVAEEALQLTNKKFTNRFKYIEKYAFENNLDLNKMTLEEMDNLWNEAKKLGIK